MTTLIQATKSLLAAASVVIGIPVALTVTLFVIIQLVRLISTHPFPAIGLAIAIAVLSYAALEIKADIKRTRQKIAAENVTCVHGVPGGTTRDLCGICREEKANKLLADQKRRERAEEERQIQHTHYQLREAEIARLRQAFAPKLEELRALSPRGFENAISQLFSTLGFEVQQTPIVNDGGRDAILTKEGKKYLLECKRYAEGGSTGRPDIQKFHSAIRSDSAIGGFFVSTATFTKSAVEYAKSISEKEGIPVELVDGSRLQTILLRLNKAPDDIYFAICKTCGTKLEHHLRLERNENCPNGHANAPSISIEDVIDGSPSIPRCEKCNAQMRLIDGRYGKFWGCSNYPRCSSTKRHHRTRKRMR